MTDLFRHTDHLTGSMGAHAAKRCFLLNYDATLEPVAAFSAEIIAALGGELGTVTPLAAYVVLSGHRVRAWLEANPRWHHVLDAVEDDDFYFLEV